MSFLDCFLNFKPCISGARFHEKKITHGILSLFLGPYMVDEVWWSSGSNKSLALSSCTCMELPSGKGLSCTDWWQDWCDA